jgi:hypothetical protein
MAEDTGEQRGLIYWRALIEFAVAEGNRYLDDVERNAGGWGDKDPDHSRAIVSRAMLMHGIQIGLALAQLEPGTAKLLYDQITRDELKTSVDDAQQTRLKHVQAVQRLLAQLHNREKTGQ